MSDIYAIKYTIMNKIRAQSESVMRHKLLTLYADLVYSTPVLTGFSANNWNFAIGNNESDKPSGFYDVRGEYPSSNARVPDLRSERIQEVSVYLSNHYGVDTKFVWFHNHVRYLGFVERGLPDLVGKRARSMGFTLKVISRFVNGLDISIEINGS